MEDGDGIWRWKMAMEDGNSRWQWKMAMEYGDGRWQSPFFFFEQVMKNAAHFNLSARFPD